MRSIIMSSFDHAGSSETVQFKHTTHVADVSTLQVRVRLASDGYHGLLCCKQSAACTMQRLLA